MPYLASDNYGWKDFKTDKKLFDNEDDAEAWVKKRVAFYHQKHCVERAEPKSCVCNGDQMCAYHDTDTHPLWDGHEADACEEVKSGMCVEDLDVC